MSPFFNVFSSSDEKKNLYREIYTRDLNASINYINSVLEKVKLTLKEIYSNLDKFNIENSQKIYKFLYSIEDYAGRISSESNSNLPDLDSDHVGEYPCVDALLCKVSSVLRIVLALAKIADHHKEDCPGLVDDILTRFKNVEEVSARLQKYITEAVIRNQTNNM